MNTSLSVEFYLFLKNSRKNQEKVKLSVAPVRTIYAENISKQTHHFASLPDGGERAQMDPDGRTPSQPRYLPARIPILGTVKHSVRKVAIALIETPERACGVALRVGYTGTRETDLALYRLKVKPSPELPLVTLAGFFVLEEGRFHIYES